MGLIVKNTTFPSLLDLLAPYSCRGCDHIGTPLCDRCKKYIIAKHQNHCPICKQEIPNTGLCQNCPKLPPTFTIESRDSLLGTLVHDLKYSSVRPLARSFADILDQTLPAFSSPKNILVPLPTIKSHVRSRGLDHTLLIAKHLKSLRGKNYKVSSLLLRAKNTIQVGSDRKTRLSQAASAYQINPKIKIDPSATYFLLDDVWTTGATMQAAYDTLLDAGAKNINLVALTYST